MEYNGGIEKAILRNSELLREVNEVEEEAGEEEETGEERTEEACAFGRGGSFVH